MRYALIDLATNIVVNVVEITPGDGSEDPAGFKTVQSDGAGIGATWDGTKFIEPPQRVDQNI